MEMILVKIRLEPILKKIDFSKIPITLKKIKPETWAKIAIGAAGGIVLGALIRQPEINKLKNVDKKALDENERLRLLIKSYHEEFHELKTRFEALKAYQLGEHIREYGDLLSYVMYQYAAKEYIELSRKTDVNKKIIIPEESKEFYFAFKEVINGKKLSSKHAKAIKEYIYPKYKNEIESLKECSFDEIWDHKPA